MALTILVCSDGSERARAALPHARRIADAIGARVLAFQVITGLADETILLERAMQRVAMQAARTRQRLRRAAGSNADDALAAVTHPGEKVHERILAAARDHDAALIVLAARGANIFREAIVGSVSQAVVQSSAVPVLVTGRHVAATDPAAAGPYRLVAVLEGAAPVAAIRASLGPVATSASVRITAVRLVRPGDPPAPDDGATVVASAGAGQASEADAVIGHALGQRADAIAAARAPSLSLRRQLLRRSLATQLIDRSPLPVIITPAS
jgi:nucleotide-binding universal stress UspA family protein